MLVKELGRLLIDLNPNLHVSKDPKHLESIVLGSSILKTIGESLVKHSGKKSRISGGSAVQAHKKAESMLVKNLEHFANKLPGKVGSGLKVKNVKALTKKLDSKKISAKDLLGEDWRRKGQEIMKRIDELHRRHQGGNIFKDIGHGFSKLGKSIKHGLQKVGSTVKKAGHEMGRFFKGETKFKPSQLAGYIAGGLGVVAGVATLQPELIGVSAGVISGVAGVAGGVGGILSTSGRGRNMPMSARKFSDKHPEKAQRILDLLHTSSGEGLTKKAKNILKVAGAVGLTGALSFLGWAQGRDSNVMPPKLDHTLPDDAWLGLGMEGEGWSDVKEFLKKNKKKALAILLGVATTGALVAGQTLFKQKYGGIAPTSNDGKAIIKHLLSGSQKKLEVGNIMLAGKKVIHLGGKYQDHTPLLAGRGVKPSGGQRGYGMFTNTMAKFIKSYPDKAMEIVELIKKETKGNGLQGQGIVSKVKNILSLVGVVGLIGAYSFAKWYLNIRQNATTPENRSIDKALWKVKSRLLKDSAMSISEIVNMIGQKGSGVVPSGGALKPAGKRGSGVKPSGGRKRKVGKKQDVWDGLADRTSGGLYRKDLRLNAKGKVVSILQSENGKKRMVNLKRRT